MRYDSDVSTEKVHILRTKTTGSYNSIRTRDVFPVNFIFIVFRKLFRVHVIVQEHVAANDLKISFYVQKIGNHVYRIHLNDALV